MLAATVITVLAASLIYGLAIVYANELLSIRGPAGRADIMVVLGGDGPARAQHAALIWRKSAAPLVLITGWGDCQEIRQRMIDMGVAPSVITTECQSRSTWENATFSAVPLRKMAVHRAILVTSWFHSRRAIASFQAVLPEIEWMSSPAEPKMTRSEMLFDYEGIQVFKEYPKTLWYRMRYIAPHSLGMVALKTERRAPA